MNPNPQYYYRPLAVDGRIYKCAGHGAEWPSHRAFYESCFNLQDSSSVYRPGLVILEGYRGDRIKRDSAGNWQDTTT